MENRIQRLKLIIPDDLKKFNELLNNSQKKNMGKNLKNIVEAFQTTSNLWNEFLQTIILKEENIERYSSNTLGELIESVKSSLVQSSIDQWKRSIKGKSNQQYIADIENLFDLIIGRTNRLDYYIRVFQAKHQLQLRKLPKTQKSTIRKSKRRQDITKWRLSELKYTKKDQIQEPSVENQSEFIQKQSESPLLIQEKLSIKKTIS